MQAQPTMVPEVTLREARDVSPAMRMGAALLK
jgi:hypothetical protein